MSEGSEALEDLQGERRTNVTTNCQREDDKPVPPNLAWNQSRRPVERKLECVELYGKWEARGSCLLPQVTVFAISFLALFLRRNHLDEIYSSIDIFNRYFQCNYTYRNSACEIHIKCREYNELFIYALRESFIIHTTYAFFYIIRIIFWANLQFLHFFSIIH